MPIQFPCPQCRKTLRVADEHAGKTAKCPDCEALTQIPSHQIPDSQIDKTPESTRLTGSASTAKYELPNKQETEVQNPYATTYSSNEDFAKPTKPTPSRPGSMRPRRVSFEEVFTLSWELWKRNLGLLAGVTAVLLTVSCVFGFAEGFVQEILLAANNDPNLAGLAGNLIAWIGNAVELFLGIGQVRIFLNIIRGEEAEFSTLFSGSDRFLPLLGATIIAYLCVVIGFLLLIVPGVMLCLYYWGYYFLIIDGRSPAMESFSTAYEFCQFNKGTAFLIFLISIPIALAGVLALCVGLLFALPLIGMLWAVAYLKMSGQIR